MNSSAAISDPQLLARLRDYSPLMWINDEKGCALPDNAPSAEDVAQAQKRFERSAQLLALIYPQLASTQGHIESDLIEIPHLQQLMEEEYASSAEENEKWFLKADHALPIAGSIKARGGFHEILALAERIAIENNIVKPDEDLIKLASTEAKALFSEYKVMVGSTGNLGLSIGIMAAALGFQATVHMSVEAKQWKKDRLRSRGVNVIEHSGDYAAAVAAGRTEALATPKCHFVDDEQSVLLFLGYAASAQYVAEQLKKANRIVDETHPLFVYVPCGVGGAPGGITYGLKLIFGDNVHCFFAEPVASPCMLVQLASKGNTPLSVYDIGLSNQTEADGLAVALASHLVSPLMRSQLSGVYTVSNDQLYKNLYSIKETEHILLEPSAAASLHGPVELKTSHEGHQYLHDHRIDLRNATHIIWSTGGSLVPEEELKRFQEKGKSIFERSSDIN